MGPRTLDQKTTDNQAGADTIYHTIPTFNFIDQDSNQITEKTFEGKIYITDFFFTSCPSICPKMKAQLLRVYDRYLEENKIVILSHSIDTYRDSVAILKEYAEKLDVKTYKWHFVTGKEEDIYEMATNYFISALKDKQAPGGYIHSGALVLVDEQKRIRGFYDGTDTEAVDKLLEDIPLLLDETQ